MTISTNAVNSASDGTVPTYNIRLKGSTLSFSTNGLNLNANGGVTGKGGVISVEITGGTVTAGTATTLKASAVGGTRYGDGGSISIS